MFDKMFLNLNFHIQSVNKKKVEKVKHTKKCNNFHEGVPYNFNTFDRVLVLNTEDRNTL